MPAVARVIDTPPEVMPSKGSLWSEVDAIFVNHTAFRTVRQRIEELMPLQGTGGAMPCVPFVGPTGVGKTTIFRKLQEAFPVVADARRVELDTGEILICDHVPILCVRMPTSIGETAIIKLLLKGLGDQFSGKGDKQDKLERVVLLLAACGTKLVLIDEGQRLVERTGVLTANKVIDLLKDIHELACVCFVMLALERIKKLYEEDGQIDRRWSRQREISPYAWGELDAFYEEEEAQPREHNTEKEERFKNKVPQSRLDFMGLLVGFKNSCPVAFSKELDVTRDDVAYRFYYVSRGVAGYVKKLLLAAMRLIKPGGLVDLALLSSAFRDEFRSDIKHRELQDPFVEGWIPCKPPALIDDGSPGRTRRPRKDDTLPPLLRRGKASDHGKVVRRTLRAKDADTALCHALSRG